MFVQKYIKKKTFGMIELFLKQEYFFFITFGIFIHFIDTFNIQY